MDIVRASHVEFYVTDIGRARDFYVDTLGFVVTAEEGGRLFLRGLEDRFHHCLVLTEKSKPGLGHLSFRVRTRGDMDSAVKLLKKHEMDYIEVEEGEEAGQGRALRFQDGFGFPVELFNEMDAAEWKLQRFDEHRGAKIMRIDHFNMFVPDVDTAFSWYSRALSFDLTEYVEGKAEGRRMSAAWLRRKPSSHDVALMEGSGPRFHHAGFIVSDKDSILDCADILSSRGYISSMERGPGRHGITNAFFFYLRDQDGNRIELYTGDYLTADPYLPPVVWKATDPRRQTFWGAPTPESWWREASPVYSVMDGSRVQSE